MSFVQFLNLPGLIFACSSEHILFKQAVYFYISSEFRWQFNFIMYKYFLNIFTLCSDS